MRASRAHPPVKAVPGPKSIRTTKAYDQLLRALYTGARRRVDELVIPPLPVIAVRGNEPPTGKRFPEAITVLYGLAYTIKMGLKFGALPRPRGYFDYKVGALETFWWSTRGDIDITNAKTLRWQAFLMVPGFVDGKLVEAARKAAKAKHPEVPYERAKLATVDEGHSVQMLHVGRYDREQPTIEALHEYVAEHGFAVAGRHHEIYISDPRRTPPEKLKTVIRCAVKPARRVPRATT